MKFVSSEEMGIIEENASYFGITHDLLMENAGRSVAEKVSEMGDRFLVVCGPGNNGGDGLCAARHLLQNGKEVRVLLFGKKMSSPEGEKNLRICSALGIVDRIRDQYELIEKAKEFRPQVLIDALLGTGVRGEIREPYLSLIRALNKLIDDGITEKAISIDLPSGMDPNTGKGIFVKSHMTITLHKPKIGLRSFEGDVVIGSLGIPPEIETLCGPGDLKAAIPARREDSHKGENGKVLIVGGSRDLVGAPALAAMASLSVGVDLVRVICPERVAFTINSLSPDVISLKLNGEFLSLEHVENILEEAERNDVTLIGPGIGRRKETVRALEELLSHDLGRLVIDADALRVLGSLELGSEEVIITPHRGELSSILGREVSNPLLDAREISNKMGVVVLLKGREDLIVQGERYKRNVSGNPGMTVGGTGDVLAGVTAGILSRGRDPFLVACASAFLVGLVGDTMLERRGYFFSASELIEGIPSVLTKMGIMG